MNIRCLRCKGRGYCGRDFCPHVAKTLSMVKVKEKLTKEDFFGSSPAVFVGRVGYPNINVGILSPAEKPDNIWEYDAPRHWSSAGYDIPKIVDFRSALINSRFKSGVKERTKMLELGQEISMSSSPVDVEVNLYNKPKFRVYSNSFTAPTGPNAKLKKVELAENPKVHTKVDKVVADTDFKANDALIYLYKNNFDENFLSKLLSVGNLGVKVQRKLVPTRWSITAVDDAIAKNHLARIKDYSCYDYAAYFGSYLGNYYLILMFPDVWSYELFETYLPKASWNVSDTVQFTTDYENCFGRKNYAENCAGGYYSVRMAVTEHLINVKKQASVLVLRFITGEYAVPLGVWVTREAARKALSNKPIIFSSKELMLKYTRQLIRKKFGYDLDNILKESVVLRELNKQMKLGMF